jgi:hypothetical protein
MNQEFSICLRMRSDPAADATRLLPEPLKKTGGVFDLRNSLRVRLALLGGKQARDFILSANERFCDTF